MGMIRTTAIVPTLGTSRWLVESLEALREEGGSELEIVLVAQGRRGGPEMDAAARLAERTLRLDHNVGFAAANNRALAEARGELVATINDDAVVEPGWYGALVEVLEAAPDVAAVQGVNLKLDDPRLADGAGILWNRSWQAVQIAHGEPAPRTAGEPVEIFGVSATAAIYRRPALGSAARPGWGDGLMFDPRLVSYYEDVDLACRLRGAGFRALLVPAARVRHAGSESRRRLALGGWPLVYGNRHLVLARLLGRAHGSCLPAALTRDVKDLANALRRARIGQAAGIVAGWGRAAAHLRHYRHGGSPAVALEELQSVARGTMRRSDP